MLSCLICVVVLDMCCRSWHVLSYLTYVVVIIIIIESNNYGTVIMMKYAFYDINKMCYP